MDPIKQNGKETIKKYEKDFIIVNLTCGYIFNLEVKKTLNQTTAKHVRDQLKRTKKLFEKWFGADFLEDEWKYFSGIYCEYINSEILCGKCYNSKFIFTNPANLREKLEEFHCDLDREKRDTPTHESFHMLAKYLLFYSTYNKVPVSSVIDSKIKENLDKSGNADNVILWNWTPGQKSLLDGHVPLVIFTSYWSTGKTRVMFEKAKELARHGEKVIFAIANYRALLLYQSLANELKRFERNENIYLMTYWHNDLDDADELLEKLKSQPGSNLFIDELDMNFFI